MATYTPQEALFLATSDERLVHDDIVQDTLNISDQIGGPPYTQRRNAG